MRDKEGKANGKALTAEKQRQAATGWDSRVLFGRSMLRQLKDVSAGAGAKVTCPRGQGLHSPP